MANFIALLALIISFYFYSKKKSQEFLVTFFLICLFAPSLRLGAFYFSPVYITLIYPILFFLSHRKVYITSKASIFLTTSILVLIASMLGWIINAKAQTNIIFPLLGSFKYFVVVVFGVAYYRKYVNDKGLFLRVVKIIVLLNFCAVAIQLLFPHKAIIFFYNLYWEPSLKVYDNLLEFVTYHGYFKRFMGFFGSPVNFGITMLLCWTYLITEIIFFSRYYLTKITILCLIVGFLSLSKTFIIGSPLFFILTFLYQNVILKTAVKKLITTLFIIILISGITLIVVKVGSNHSKFVKYYSEYLFKPGDAIKSRYSSRNDLLLSKTYDVIKENILFGVGPASLKDEFVGDSEYVKQLHNGGLIAFILLLTFIVIMLLKFFIEKNHQRLVLFIALCAAGTGIPVILASSLSIPFLIFLLSNKNHDVLAQKV